MIVVDLALAVVCFTFQGQDQCHPALVGMNTPKGQFSLVQRLTDEPGYGGDVLQFHETQSEVFALHRVWELIPSERRRERLSSPVPAKRQNVTAGCINVSHEVYEIIARCCINQPLVIR